LRKKEQKSFVFALILEILKMNIKGFLANFDL
jgi:hypothetical protein